MITRNSDFFAKCYFVLRRFPLGDEFYEDAYKNRDKRSIKESIDKYCLDLLKNPNIANSIQKDFDEHIVPRNMEHILK
jgi:hypothetical protein